MTNSVKRATHVVNVLFKHGLGYFVHELGLKWHLPFFSKLAPQGRPPTDLPVRLRKAMEELGGAYVKLGQFLALRPDLLPAAYCLEFQKLLDTVPPLPFKDVQEIIEKNLKAPTHHFFSHIEPKAIGSASIAQVHRAKLKNGKNVVLKVQRPDAKEQFAADIQIMYYLAHKLDKRFRDKPVSPVTVVKEFERYTAQELNFVIEARTIDRFHQFFKNSTSVVIPRVYWQSTTNQLLTMDWLDGTKLTALLKNPDHTRASLLARRIADATFDQVLKLGVFHADMHPGNIMVMPGNKIGLLDFGIVGNLNEELLRETVAIYAGLISKDANAITNVLLKVGTPAPDANIDDLRLDVEHIVNEWYGTDLGQSRVTQMFQSLFETSIEHKVMLPVSFILLGKAFVTVEGTCLALDPDFNFIAYSQPRIEKLIRQQAKPTVVLKHFGKISKQYADMLATFPAQAAAIAERVKRGSIDLNLKETDVKHLGMDLNRSSNRLSYSLIIAALLLTGAMLIDVPPKLGAYSVFTIMGIGIAACLLMVLLVSVWREGTEPFDPHRDMRR
jgi:ubiquinone biosynthesis protein